MIALDPQTSQRVLAASRTTWFWYHSMKDLSGRSLANDEAGWLDGALGVLYALETARAVAESGAYGESGVDVIAFADEEGHFSDMPGSNSWVGQLTEETIDKAVDRTHGQPLREALAKAGLAGKPRRQMERDRYLCFLEAHIEQGAYLEQAQQHVHGAAAALVGPAGLKAVAIVHDGVRIGKALCHKAQVAADEVHGGAQAGVRERHEARVPRRAHRSLEHLAGVVG